MGAWVIKMSWEDILKAPPIRNPREAEFKDNANDDLSRTEYVELFQERVDPIIEREGKLKSTYASIPLSDLLMSPRRAVDVAEDLYSDMGYNMIFTTDGKLIFKLEGEGRV